jgi:hypothetical protein
MPVWPISQASAHEPPPVGSDHCGEKPLRLVDLRHLSEVLQIDRARAVVAIEILIGAAMMIQLCNHDALIGPVVAKVNAGADFPIEALTGPPKTSRLAGQDHHHQ